MARTMGCALLLALAAIGCSGADPAPRSADPAPPGERVQAARSHLLAARLQSALASETDADRAVQLRDNLARLALAPLPEGRHVLVDLAAARLYLMNGDRIEGAMAVVVGSPRDPTPLLDTEIVRLVARPYWNVPLDLAQRRMASEVVRYGPRWLAARGMETLNPNQETPQLLPASAIDWRAVAKGQAEARIRQRPGHGNMMGSMKFELRNGKGIYLHDSPERQYFAHEQRALSAGCIRLSDWKQLADWLWDGALPDGDGRPEQYLELETPVPIRIVYLTLSPLGVDGWLPAGTLARQPDPYGLDQKRALARTPDSRGLPS